eukprot:COSAG02_NODE_99_length_37069_cov_24.910957_29_plen_75_part_00
MSAVSAAAAVREALNEVLHSWSLPTPGLRQPVAAVHCAFLADHSGDYSRAAHETGTTAPPSRSRQGNRLRRLVP